MKKIVYILLLMLTISAVSYSQNCDNTHPPPSPTVVNVNLQTKQVTFPCTGACVENNIQIWIIRVRQGVIEYRDAGYLVQVNCAAYHYSALPENILQREAKRMFNWDRGGGYFYYQYQVGATQSIIFNY